VRSGLFIPLFDALADPAVVVRLSAEAEEAGWDGVFVWDNLRFVEPVVDVADPWITLAAVATATERIRLGPLVTPLARRRPAKVARETATLDRLSGGRLTLGVGLGSDGFASEYSMTGEELDDRRRASMLDESLEILAAAWSGEPVHHRGEHHTVDGMDFLPRPVQRPGVPVWVAGYYGKRRPLRRAARHQGFFPLGLDRPEQLAEIVAELTTLRADAGAGLDTPYDVVVALPPGEDPAPYAAAGATWWLVEFPWDAVSVDQVRAVIREGPARSSENVALVRRLYAELASEGSGEDFDTRLTDEALSRFLDADIEWLSVPDSLLADESYRGFEGVRRFWREFVSAWESYRVEPLRFDDIGDRVAVVVRIVGRTHELEVDETRSSLLTVRDGRIVRVESFADPDGARSAAAG
jgi:alkanesulfonate monooxygenase SsuD/methylene tetrahydromethanopterin reductase-like flavin-dependent oxidoreductase (luciferase family)/ketosteroid isomerase-like protein